MHPNNIRLDDCNTNEILDYLAKDDPEGLLDWIIKHQEILGCELQ